MLHGDRVPRLLSCGHSVCHDCLSKLTICGQVLLCPFDREPTSIGDSGIWGLKKNFALLDLLERLQLEKENHEITPSEDEAVDRIRCDENEKHLATLYCLVCSTHLCNDCSNDTHSTKTLSRHQRVSISDKPKGILLSLVIHVLHSFVLCMFCGTLHLNWKMNRNWRELGYNRSTIECTEYPQLKTIFAHHA